MRNQRNSLSEDLKSCDTCRHRLLKAKKGEEPCWPCIPGTADSRWERIVIKSAEEYLQSHKDLYIDTADIMRDYALYVIEITNLDAYIAGWDDRYNTKGNVLDNYRKWREQQ